MTQRWRESGLWQQLHEALCKQVRKHAGKKPTPSVAILDSQSIRTVEGGVERGYNAGKQITCRKRHIAVDTLGLIWAVVVHGAYWQDQVGAWFVLQWLPGLKSLRVLFADSVHAISYDIEATVFSKLGDFNDGKIIPQEALR